MASTPKNLLLCLRTKRTVKLTTERLFARLREKCLRVISLPRKSEAVEYNTLAISFKLWSIFKVLCPIRVFLIGSSCVPGSEVFRTLPKVLFGRLLGYLYTTLVYWLGEDPAVRNLFLPIGFLRGVIQVPRVTAEKLQQDMQPFQEPGYQNNTHYQVSTSIVTVPDSGSDVPMGSSSTEPGYKETPARTIRRELMIPAGYPNRALSQRGFWYPRNQLMRPFWKGRKPTERWTMEKSFGILLYGQYI